ncbi:DUF418 domain-containing protein [uncultured Sphingomonas sp.]|uniref:DUF418 domain-containing protein n=1 Tax=uncultured Sphingomonas sp. TaxID=158754 RepID=UPI002621E036|nr:DUF418 domain-containing protein [uncultured Sphingomonas sp.]
MPDPSTTNRLLSLDVIRGVAVMGILVANLAAFGLPEAAYFAPLAWGGTAPADLFAWFITFVFIEGKMRGLFSFLFGASILIVTDAAERHGDNAAATHYRRMATLFVIGCAHLYLVWLGDILAHYALVGAIAFLFAWLSVRWLIAAALLLLAYATISSALGAVILFDSAAQDSPYAIAIWNSFAIGFGVPPRADMLGQIAAMRGSWIDAIAWRWHHAADPLTVLPVLAPETLSAMLLGMAGYRSGFLCGAWHRARYRRWALFCLGVALPAYAMLGMVTLRHGFAMQWVYLNAMVLAEPLRTLGFIGYAALLMLALRPGGPLTLRLAAVGRTAFSNYLGTSLLMVAIFNGLSLFGALSRAQLYLLVPPAWGLMLLWSKPWCDRFHHGPFEWLWRSAARGRWQPLRRVSA